MRDKQTWELTRKKWTNIPALIENIFFRFALARCIILSDSGKKLNPTSVGLTRMYFGFLSGVIHIFMLKEGKKVFCRWNVGVL